MSFPKPLRGTALLERRERRAKATAHEKAVMHQARVRDGFGCRVPRCEFKAQKLPLDVAHRVHRGMGGDPTGTRTTLDGLIALCRVHHAMYDAAQINIDPLSPEGFSGPCEFSRLTESGRWDVFATERRIGVPGTRGV